ncbi:MAG: hypothetical protein RLZ97_2568 [Verrucomicrobiota bacterium]|jgi:enamine deaminase RidA (YjgF/YER057c/UK114 family)
MKRIAAHGLARGIDASAAGFVGVSGVEEWHVTIRLHDSVHSQAGDLLRAWHETLESLGIPVSSTVMKRICCRDTGQQASGLHDHFVASPGALSIIGQAPLGRAGIALWSQHVIDPAAALDTIGGGTCFQCRRGSLRHVWLCGMQAASHAGAADQTSAILRILDEALSLHDLNLHDHVLRTWWFVRDIDHHYQGLVDARRKAFDVHKLTEDTHYIASTGIGGHPPDPAALVMLDSYAVGGISPGQITYLSAPDFLGPTHRYGVTFERATAISYADRRHILLSGTASIDPEGRIVHPDDVIGQLERTLENITALLAAGGGSLQDLGMILVYLRDPGDGPRIEKILHQRFNHLPMILLHAPVCRPGWLVEIEGIATVEDHQPEFPAF